MDEKSRKKIQYWSLFVVFGLPPLLFVPVLALAPHIQTALVASGWSKFAAWFGANVPLLLAATAVFIWAFMRVWAAARSLFGDNAEQAKLEEEKWPIWPNEYDGASSSRILFYFIVLNVMLWGCAVAAARIGLTYVKLPLPRSSLDLLFGAPGALIGHFLAIKLIATIEKRWPRAKRGAEHPGVPIREVRLK